MSSTDETTPKIDTKRGRRPDTEPKPAGRMALEQALSESGMVLEDLTRAVHPTGPAQRKPSDFD
ncbi:hypothetical protein [Nonomuraea insulae]|uniref:Uncharacterized protein n=1 Tax=Nonomuraea insulae TaxID=1616787 RepID=A0ABW1CCD0_9ACTN